MLGPRPPEPARCSDEHTLAPGFQILVRKVIAAANVKLAERGYHFQFQSFECARSGARQHWLFGSGRTYAGPWLTNSDSCFTSWHGFGLADDVVPRAVHTDGSFGDFTWDVPAGVWAVLYEAATENGCTTGLHWHSQDDDHVQPANVKVSPSDNARELFANGGLPAVWAACGYSDTGAP